MFWFLRFWKNRSLREYIIDIRSLIQLCVLINYSMFLSTYFVSLLLQKTEEKKINCIIFRNRRLSSPVRSPYFWSDSFQIALHSLWHSYTNRIQKCTKWTKIHLSQTLSLSVYLSSSLFIALHFFPYVCRYALFYLNCNCLCACAFAYFFSLKKTSLDSIMENTHNTTLPPATSVRLMVQCYK